MAMLGYCQSAALATVAETAQVFKDAHVTLRLVCHSSYGLTINGKLLADCSLTGQTLTQGYTDRTAG